MPIIPSPRFFFFFLFCQTSPRLSIPNQQLRHAINSAHPFNSYFTSPTIQNHPSSGNINTTSKTTDTEDQTINQKPPSSSSSMVDKTCRDSTKPHLFNETLDKEPSSSLPTISPYLFPSHEIRKSFVEYLASIGHEGIDTESIFQKSQYLTSYFQSAAIEKLISLSPNLSLNTFAPEPEPSQAKPPVSSNEPGHLYQGPKLAVLLSQASYLNRTNHDITSTLWDKRKQAGQLSGPDCAPITLPSKPINPYELIPLDHLVHAAVEMFKPNPKSQNNVSLPQQEIESFQEPLERIDAQVRHSDDLVASNPSNVKHSWKHLAREKNKPSSGVVIREITQADEEAITLTKRKCKEPREGNYKKKCA
ncbi:hypothetical protein GH714_010669 [Hevea brasiliensis]|uniref:Uncharacterized protein n=1 Tax=Hevea brasiliensis TaxID=3981 RepID=A0A6A6M0L6_HEVBR|nr:hypothetical protein GH714_010669 [Hevea brasiliensis]